MKSEDVAGKSFLCDFFFGLGMDEENFSQNFGELFLEKYESEKGAGWINILVLEISLSN